MITYLVPKIAPDYYLVLIKVYQLFLAGFRVSIQVKKAKIKVFETNSKQSKQNQFKYCKNEESSNKAWIMLNFFLLKPKKAGTEKSW